MKNGRLFQIVYILLEKQSITAPELARQLEVSVRTIYRDINDLSISGIPIYSIPGKGGGIRLMPGYTFDKTLFSKEEQNQILFALQSFQAVDQNVTILLSKLSQIFQRASTNWIEVDFSRWGHSKADKVKFEQLKKSILERHFLFIQYCGANGTVTERKIKPYKLIFKEKNWYVQAFCQRAGDVRTFKISRIIQLTLLDEQFFEDFSTIPYIDDTEQPDTRTISLVLKISPKAGFRVYDEFAPDNIKKQPDGFFLVHTEMPYDSWLFNYIISFGTHAEIIKPLYLKEEVGSYVKNIYNHYIT